MKRLLQRLWSEEHGATATEYGIIAAILAVAIIGVLWKFSGALSAMFEKATANVTPSGN